MLATVRSPCEGETGLRENDAFPTAPWTAESAPALVSSPNRHLAAVAAHLNEEFVPQKLPRKAKPALMKRNWDVQAAGRDPRTAVQRDIILPADSAGVVHFFGQYLRSDAYNFDFTKNFGYYKL